MPTVDVKKEGIASKPPGHPVLKRVQVPLACKREATFLGHSSLKDVCEVEGIVELGD